MEVAMTRRASCYTLFALAAVALGSISEGRAASAEPDPGYKQEMEYLKQEKSLAPLKPRTHKGLATEKDRQRSNALDEIVFRPRRTID
jgi:hypothetical protein